MRLELSGEAARRGLKRKGFHVALLEVRLYGDPMLRRKAAHVREVTPELEAEIRAHIQKCPPCNEHFDFETLFLKFVRVRCRAQGAPATLRRRILEQLLEE